MNKVKRQSSGQMHECSTAHARTYMSPRPWKDEGEKGMIMGTPRPYLQEGWYELILGATGHRPPNLLQDTRNPLVFNLLTENGLRNNIVKLPFSS